MSIVTEGGTFAVAQVSRAPEMIENSYWCRAAIITEADGTFSACAINLPGIGSCGETEIAAIDGFREAMGAALQEYLEGGGEIPWDHKAECPPDAKELRIVVNV